jgi:hypothetical protein
MKRNQCQSAAWGKRFLMLCTVILSASLAFAGSRKMAKDLEGKNPSDQVDVIVQFTQAPTARHHQKVFNRGGQLRHELGLVKSGAYSLPAGALNDLAADPDVAYISPDRVWSSIFHLSFPYYVLSAGVTSLVTSASHRIGWQIPLLVLPTMYGVNKSYRLYFGRAEALARPIASAKAAGAK